MKRKKGRHKLIAIEFLSNISLDGCYNKQLAAVNDHPSAVQFDHHRKESPQTPVESGLGLTTALCNVIDTHTTTDASPNSAPLTEAVSPDCHCYKPVLSNGDTLQRSLVNEPQVTQVKNGCDTCLPNNLHTKCSSRPPFATDMVRPIFTLDNDAEFFAPSSNKLGHNRERDIHLSQGNFHIPTDLPINASRRVTLCPLGLHETRLSVFSIIPYTRKNSTITTRNMVRIPRLTPASAKGSTDMEMLPTTFQLNHAKQPQSPHHIQHQQQQSTSNSSGSREHQLTSFTPDSVSSLSSLRPTGDEVVSYARFLKPHINLWLSNQSGASSRLKPTGFASFAHRDSDPISPGSVDWGPLASGREIPFNEGLRSSLLAAAFAIPANRCQTRHLSTASLGAATSWTRTNAKFTRVRHPSGGSTLVTSCIAGVSGHPPWTPSAATAGISYPDPLMFYMPSLLDDPDLLVSTGKRVLKLSNYLTSVITYVRPSEQKRNVNREFHERFPLVQLTLTKLRSIKSVMVRIVHKLALDLWVAAHSHVLFEKLILRFLINKANRKLCASAALLISAKLNDVKGPELLVLLQELENNFRISRRDLIHTELDVALSLEFCLVPNELEIVPHYFRIYKNLDLTPPYPIPCLGHLPHSASLSSVTE